MSRIFLSVIFLALLIWPLSPAAAADLTATLSGRILLQVEAHGEAWYVSPANKLRYYLGRPYDAFQVMRNQGVGAANTDIAKIPVGHTDPGLNRPEDEYTSSIRPHDIAFAKQQAGRILLQVEAHGEAWYIYPVDLKRYYLGRPLDAFNVMRSLGLGITNANLAKIPADNPNYYIAHYERLVFDLVNQRRRENSLPALKWNEDLARVAREHSIDLADENRAFTGLGVSCNFPLIHHEGLQFGLYNNNRLNTRDIYYFNKSGENIALMPGASMRYTYTPGDPIVNEIRTCENQRLQWDANFDAEIHRDYSDDKKLAIVRSEIAKRTAAYNSGHALNVVTISWATTDQVAADTVQGWMDSPGHKQNMLDDDYDESGMGAAYINGYLITTQNFIRRVDCGYKNGVCCEKEGYYPYCYEPLKCINEVCL